MGLLLGLSTTLMMHFVQMTDVLIVRFAPFLCRVFKFVTNSRFWLWKSMNVVEHSSSAQTTVV